MRQKEKKIYDKSTQYICETINWVNYIKQLRVIKYTFRRQ